MSVVETIKSVVSTDSSPDETRFECTECGHEFGSYKSPDRVSCEECLSRDVEPVGSA